jgi:2-oxoglutarate/2-oxoacid ferredoxin oxidoreductase subunit beta
MNATINEMNKTYDITTKCFGKITLTGERSLLISKRQRRSFNNTSFDLKWIKVRNIEEGDYVPLLRSKSIKPPIIRNERYAYLPIRKIKIQEVTSWKQHWKIWQRRNYLRGAPACGDFNILFAIKNAFAELEVDLENTVIVSGIGCGSKTPHFVHTYGFEGLHGRTLPVATGIKLANSGLKVIVVGGDGDGYGIGGNHLIHSMRRNLDIPYLIQNNAVYGLTKGQYSPTSEKGMKTPTSLDGSIEEGVNPMALAITMGTTYAARGYAYEVKHLQELIVNGVKHKGFSFIDIFQPCSTYNKIQTIAWYKQMLVKMEEIGHDPTNKEEAMKKAMMTEKLPIGLFFKEERATYEDGVPQIAETPLVQQDINNVDIKGMLDRFKW